MQFQRIEPTTVHEVGSRFKKVAVVKTFRSDDGQIHEFTTWGKEGTRCGAVIAITRDKQVIVSYEFRAGPERWMQELPGGNFNDGEDLGQAAMRELKEETGYVSDNVEYLGESSRDAYTNGKWHYYLATDCYLSKEGQNLDEEEVEQGLEVQFISIDQLIENARTDQMTDQVAVLMAYERLQEIKNER